MSIEAELYVPSVPRFPDDLVARDKVLDIARERGVKNTGLMLVILRPQDVWEAREVQKQLDNLDFLVGKSETERPGVFVMQPWKPLTGTTDLFLNFLTRPSFSKDYIGKAIDFAARIPSELTPRSGRAVSFHLSAYVTPDLWKNDLEYWRRESEKVSSALGEVVQYGSEKGVRVHIENVPVPPFGDWELSDSSRIPGTNFHFRDLGTPWPGLPWREISQIREAGLAWTIDICHMHTAVASIEEVYRFSDKELREKALGAYMIFDSDLKKAEFALNNFSGELLEVVQDGDIVHISQATGKFMRSDLHGKDGAYGDSSSVVDPQGNISQRDLRKIIRGTLQRPVKLVVEVNEPRDKMLEAPNTRASLGYILTIAQGLRED